MQDISDGVKQSLSDYCSSKSDKIDSNVMQQSTNTPQNDIPTENFIELDDISTDTKTTQRTIKNTKNTSINKNAQNISNVINSSVNLISQGTSAKLEINDVINLAGNIGTIKEMYTDIKTSGQKIKTKIQNHFHRE